MRILQPPTGISAINFSGTTINLGLAIPINIRGTLPRTSGRNKFNLM